jgi:hypothetical protein
MDPTTFQIKDFNSIIKIGTTFGKNWYRGHSRVFNNLTPKVFRPEYQTIIDELLRPQFEFETVENFKRYAPSVLGNLPASSDNLSWLLIMQHHGFTTRLLDWSENILVALFFAIVDLQNEDGELWSIYPYKLNQCSGFDGIPLPNSRLLAYLSNEPFHNAPEMLVKEYNLPFTPIKPIAFLPTRVIPRISNQMSTFTIHPKPREGNTIPELISGEENLVRYIIPSKLKSVFEKNLSYLGISYRTLFPDIEGLSKDFKREEKYYGWGQPRHPKIE